MDFSGAGYAAAWDGGNGRVGEGRQDFGVPLFCWACDGVWGMGWWRGTGLLGTPVLLELEESSPFLSPFFSFNTEVLSSQTQLSRFLLCFIFSFHRISAILVCSLLI